MKPRFRLAVLFLLAALLLPVRLPADPIVRKIAVNGTATIKIAPDEMRWSVQISINDATLAKAKARHDASLTGLLAYLKGLGTSIRDLQTGGIRFEKRTYYNKDNPAKPFDCSTALTFTLTDFDQYGPLADAIAKFDGASVQSMAYDSSKADDLQSQALQQALSNAQAKAGDLAKTAGLPLGKPLEISENGGGGMRPMMMFKGAMASDVGTPAAVPGQMEITANISATYELDPVAH